MIPSTFHRNTRNSVLTDPEVAVHTPVKRSSRLQTHTDSTSQELSLSENSWCRSSTALVEKVSTKTRALALEWVWPCWTNRQDSGTPVSELLLIVTRQPLSLRGWLRKEPNSFVYRLYIPSGCTQNAMRAARLDVGLASQSQLQG